MTLPLDPLGFKTFGLDALRLGECCRFFGSDAFGFDALGLALLGLRSFEDCLVGLFLTLAATFFFGLGFALKFFVLGLDLRDASSFLSGSCFGFTLFFGCGFGSNALLFGDQCLVVLPRLGLDACALGVQPQRVLSPRRLLRR